MPMLIAEELEVGLDQVHLEHAPPNDKLYANPIFGDQETGGSTSVRAFYEPLRRAGATARTMLVAAAAETWSAETASCRAHSGVVTHTPTGRTLSYGALAEKAATLPVPAQVALKDPKDFKLIGTHARRLRGGDEPLDDIGGVDHSVLSVVPANVERRQPLLGRPHVIGHDRNRIVEADNLAHSFD